MPEVNSSPRKLTAPRALFETVSKENSEQLGLQTFGLESLIATLESLSSERRLKSYAVKNDQYTGSCFVCDGKHHRMRIRGPRSRTNNAISRLGV
ncbi:hypothetical protein C6V08_20945 [Burkholderia gladioli]|nr:hypothetical protein C6V08_20945 [Burkholderia gladioli]